MKLIDQNKLCIVDILFGLYIFTQSCITTPLIINLTLIAFCISVMIIQFRHLFFSMYSMLGILFIFYHCSHIFLGITVIDSIALDDLTRVISIFLVDLCYINYFLQKNNIKDILSIYLSASFLAYFLLLLLFGTTLNNRIESLVISKEIFGITISGGVATKVGMGASLGYFLSFIRYYDENNLKLFLYCLIFGLVTLLSGTRKVLLLILFATLLIPLIKADKVSKKMKWIITFFILAIIILQILLHIPSIYSSMYRRINRLFTFFETGSGDSSSEVRNYLLIQARNAFSQKPVLGWGLENFREIFDNGRFHCHNNYWEMLVSGGIIGFLLFYCKYILIVIDFIQLKRNNRILYFEKCFFVLFILMIVLEYWQRTYNQRTMSIIYTIIYSLFWISKNEITENNKDLTSKSI